MNSNPFQPDRPTYQKDRFINQTDLIKKVIQRLQIASSCILIGGVKMGKTSILRRLENVLADPNELCKYVDSDESTYLPVYFTPSSNFASLRLIFHTLQSHIVETVERSCDEPSFPHAIRRKFSAIAKKYKLIRPRLEWVSDDESPSKIRSAFAQDVLQLVEMAQAKFRNLRVILLLDNLEYIQDFETRDIFVQRCHSNKQCIGCQIGIGS